MQILRLGLVPGGGTRSVTFEAHQNLTSDFAHVYVICISSGWWWNLCQQLYSRSKSPASTFKPPAEHPPRSENPDPAEGGHGLLSVSWAACQQDIDCGSSGPWGVREWGPGSSLEARLDWELGSSQTRSEPWAICHVPFLNESYCGREEFSSTTGARAKSYNVYFGYIYFTYIFKIHVNARIKNVSGEQ